MKKVLDINSNMPGNAGILSNLHAHPFDMDGLHFGSMEGFLQCLRVKDPKEQIKVAALSGIAAKRCSYKHPIKNDTLYWKGQPFSRHSDKYQTMLSFAYGKLFMQNPLFQKALADTMDTDLIHSIGKTDPSDTILTVDEFIGNLKSLQVYFKFHLETL